MTPQATAYTANTLCRYCEAALINKRPQAEFCTNSCRYKFHNKLKQDRVAPVRFVNLRQTINRAKYSKTISEAQRKAVVDFLKGIKHQNIKDVIRDESCHKFR